MKKNIFKLSVCAAALALPVFAFAAGKTLRDIIAMIIDYFEVFIVLIIGLAVVTFIWNVYLYFFTDKEKTEAGMYVLYSTIGFFVILSFWGLVNIISNSLNLDTREPQWPYGTGGRQQYQSTVPPAMNLGNQGTVPPALNQGSPGGVNFGDQSIPVL